MKYLLITTTGNRNTGDELIRIGVQNLIKEVDPQPEFILFDKEISDWHTEIEFDKAILCGMPLFWNNEVSTSQTIGWWEALMRGWIVRRRKDFLILGVGNVVSDKITDLMMYGAAIQEAVDKAYAVTVRNFCGDHPELLNSICPSVFALTEIGEPKYRLCNIMPDGAHDSYFSINEADIWRRKQRRLSDICQVNDFYFIQHSNKEISLERPHELGWEDEQIFIFDTAEEYLDIYKHAECYFGNRVHGAVVTASAGRPAMAIGYDSRLAMMNGLGYAQTPSMVGEKDIMNILRYGKDQPMIQAIREKILEEKWKLLELLTKFIGS